MKSSLLLRSLVLATALISACAVVETNPVEVAAAEKAQHDAAISVALKVAIASPIRSAEFRARDIYRHPQETLSFFGIAPEMTVVEIWPGGGWYTEILAPYLREKGHYVAATFVTDGPSPSAYYQKTNEKFLAKLAASPALYDRTVVTAIGKPDHYAPVAPGSADAVLTFRNVHNWLAGGFSQEMFNAFYAALKPGGVLGVVEHRAAHHTPFEQMKTSGYVTEDYVITQALTAGFVLDDRSEINANPLDAKDYPEGVWTLPPSLELGEKDRAKYLAIGESDRMTLRFTKPRAKTGLE